MADAAVSARIDLFHGDLDGSLLHGGKDFLVVAVFAAVAGLLVDLAIKDDLAHGAVAEFQGLAGRDRQSQADCDQQNEYRNSKSTHHRTSMLSVRGISISAAV